MEDVAKIKLQFVKRKLNKRPPPLSAEILNRASRCLFEEIRYICVVDQACG